MTSPAASPTPEFLVDAPPAIEVHGQVIATPTEVQNGAEASIRGCLYGKDGHLLHLAQRLGGYHGDFYPSTDPEHLTGFDATALPILEGKSLYLGHHMPHYGHFLVEMLPTLWPYPSFREFDHFVLHPFVFGRQFPPYVETALRTMGIDLQKVHLVGRSVRLQEVTIPERLIKLNHSANTRSRDVYRELSRRLVGDVSRGGGRVYLSRVRNSLRYATRTVINEPQLERALQRMGFAIVHPESLDLPEQIALLASADVVCGLSGSALHNCVFMRPGALLIEIGDARSGTTAHPMQRLCNEIAAVATSFVAFHGRVLEHRNLTAALDVGAVTRAIAAALTGIGLPLAAKPGFTPGSVSSAARAWLGLRLGLKTRLRLLKWRLQANKDDR